LPLFFETEACSIQSAAAAQAARTTCRTQNAKQNKTFPFRGNGAKWNGYVLRLRVRVYFSRVNTKMFWAICPLLCGRIPLPRTARGRRPLLQNHSQLSALSRERLTQWVKKWLN
jgi:hypothetical protein